jgi:hypothetical protein
VIRSANSLATLGALAFCASGLVAAAPTVEASQAQQYFSCTSGHTLDVHPNGTSARCLATVLLSSAVTCASGQITVQDFIGPTDVCATVGGSTNNYACPVGYSARVQTGADVCEKVTTSIRPVDVATSVPVFGRPK